jgi:hypothetical protein
VGVSKDDQEPCAKLAMIDGATSTNPRGVKSADEVIEVYREAM